MKTEIHSHRWPFRQKKLLFIVAMLMNALSCTALQAAEWNGSSGWAKFDVEARRAMWVWNPVSVDGDKTANRNWDGTKNAKEQFFANYKGSRDMFFDFCENKSIRVVYMFTGTYQWTNYDSGTLDYAIENMLPFLTEARARGIQIWYMYYLNDDRDSATLVNNTDQILTIAQAVDTFNRDYPEASFAGIHCDQEPDDTDVYTGLLDNTKKAYEWIEESGSKLLTSQALRPTWRNQDITWNGETKIMNQHMQDWLHHSVLMAYSDTPNTVYTWSNQVITYAESLGRTAAIGSELADLEDAWTNADKETWYEEVSGENEATRFQVGSTNGTTWEDMMHEVVNRYEDNAGFDRMVIHTYSWYFKHWFGDYPRDHLLGLEDGVYDSDSNIFEKVDLGVDSRPLVEYVWNGYPIADAGGYQFVYDTDGEVGEMVELDGSGSIAGSEIVSYVWSKDEVEIASGVNPTVFLTDGVNVISLVVTDIDGLSSSSEVTIDVSPYSASSGFLFSDDFNSATVGNDGVPDPAKGWVYGIGIYMGNKDGPDNSPGARLRHNNGSMLKAIDTTGRKDITISFDVKTENYADDESGTLKWSADGGSSWTVIATYDNSHETYFSESITFPAEANDNPDFQFIFASHGSDNLDRLYIDNVIVTGTLIDGGNDSETNESYMQVVGAEFSLTGSNGSSGANDSVTLKWGSADSESYSIWSSVDLDNWTEEVSNISSAGEMTELEFTPSVVDSDKRFFQIRQN
ncbi:PKD domain-containing protein [Persicirhabdus sediminis]|uniref:Uncharacterized protein n=1 Tax=Persicirhabdus sediminis TaxID=454144 RepID=A0A8J7SL48_9BACT|nr:hypothetical protein [Persicirhabdus sediminis]MBK1792146.1 hypothetical protein [Persicirhabdus sediminis]